VIPSGLQAFSSYASLRGLVFSDQVQGDTGEHREVFRGVSGSFAALVLAEIHIQNPVQLIFHSPVLADCCIQPRGVGREAGELVM